MTAQLDTLLTRNVEGDAKEPLNELHSFISANLIEKLLGMERRWTDRDQDEGWMQHENFGEFYALRKHMFIVAFSKPELLVDSIIAVYIMSQISPMLRRLEPREPNAHALLSTCLRSCIADTAPKLRSILAEKWSAEYADILGRNANPLFPM